jgi:hypothetical protein
MTDSNTNLEIEEQNKNKKLIPDDFYRQLEVILDKDEYDLFKTKSKKRLESKIDYSDQKIQRLLILKSRSSSEIKRLAEHKKKLKTENQKLKQSIIKQLDLEVSE